MLEVVRGRRSIRRFLPKEVEERKVEQLLEAIKWAPSAGNLQARDVILVRDEETKTQLAIAALGQMFVAEAPLVFVICANKRRSGMRYGKRGEELYSIQDATAAVQNLLLMAHYLGLGACWIGAFDESEVSRILGIPKDVRPVAIIPLGYPAESPIAPPRSLSLHYEKW